MQSLLLTIAALMPAQDDPSNYYKTYVLVPYAGAFDEIFLAELCAGRVKVDLPKGISVKDGQLVLEDKPGEWKPVESLALLPMFILGQGVCHYDNEGNYFLRADWYEKFKDRLIPKHKGRLSLFPKKHEKDRDEQFVWDAIDGCWRYPETLRRVPKDHKLQTGDLLYDVPRAPGDYAPIEVILERQRGRMRE